MIAQSLTSLTEDQWDELIHDAIKQWRKPDRLAASPLLGLRQVAARQAADKLTPAVALRAVIDEAVARLAPDTAAPPSLDNPEDPRWLDYNWRPYCILRGLTARHRSISTAALQDLVGLASAHYHREYGKARMILAEELRTLEGIPMTRDEIPWRLEYPSGGMRADDPFYIEREADDKLAFALRSEGQTITIRGPRQVGKTSLLARGIHNAQEISGARLVYLDFQGVGEEARGSLGDLARVLSAHIFDTLELDLTVWQNRWTTPFLPQDNLKWLIQYALRQIDQPLLLAMDEVDILQLTPFSKDFFSMLRSWHNLRASNVAWRKLTLMMAISTEPYLLIDKVGESPFNIGHLLYLHDFTYEQTAELNRRYGAPLNAAETAALHALLNGHPYLTRVALYTLVAGGLTWPALSAAAVAEEGPFHQHLRWQLQRVEDDSRLRAAIVEVLSNRCCTDAKVGYHLLKAGLVAKVGDNYVCRCELYRQYFADRLHVSTR